jgi:rubredoxin
MSFANATMRGCDGFSRGRGNGRDGCHSRTGGRNSNSNNYGSNSNNHNKSRGNFNNSGKRLMCQVCEKEGHTTVQCWYRFDESYGAEKRAAAATTHSYGIDTNWYTNTGATDHITSELEKLDMRTKYNGNDHVHMTSGAGMNIAHIGH